MTDERVDDIREDIKEIRVEMLANFRRLEERVDISHKDELARDDDLVDYYRGKRKEIYSKIAENEQSISDNEHSISNIDKRMIKLFFIGNGIGFIAGTISSAIIMNLWR